MTTIVRYKNLVTSDTVYVDVIGTEVATFRGEPKLYHHPNFPVICALSGGICAGMFNLVNKHVNNVIANLKDYPSVDVSIDELQKEFDDSELSKGSQSGFEMGVFSKEHSLFIHFHKESKKFSVLIKPASIPMVVGSGSHIVTKLQWFQKRIPNFTAIDIAMATVRTDTFTGNNLYTFNLENLGDL